MNEEQAFLTAICDNPEDDTPRLVYADWLGEQPVERVKCTKCLGTGSHLVPDTRTKYGERFSSTYQEIYACSHCVEGQALDTSKQDRAEFIRTGIELHVPLDDPSLIHTSSCECRVCDLVNTQINLISKYAYKWRAGTVLGAVVDGSAYGGALVEDREHVIKAEWSRGFIYKVHLSTPQLFRDRNLYLTPEPCVTCGGTGNGPHLISTHPHVFDKCPVCRGIKPKRSPISFAATLVKQFPIEKIVMEGVNPLESYGSLYGPNSGRSTYDWSFTNPDAELFTIIRRLATYTGSHCGSTYAESTTMEAALELLNAACLQYAWIQAGKGFLISRYHP